MMNGIDAFILAGTKLRSHRIRTGITVGIAGLLFGLIVLIVVITQGIFSSVNRYSEVGLNDRTILAVNSVPRSRFEPYNHMDDQAFIAEVEAVYQADVASKKAAAKKFSIDYDPAVSDPSPIGTDTASGQKVITDDGLSSAAVQRAFAERLKREDTFSITDYLKPYASTTLRGKLMTVQPANGALLYMKNGEENQQVPSRPQDEYMMRMNSGESLTILDGSITKPFIAASFDTSKGEIPVVLPYSDAEKLIGLTKLSKDATLEERRERLRYVREHVHEATASFCYRSDASRELLAQAIAQQDLLRRMAGDKDFVKPSLIYKAPNKNDCSPVVIESDTRTTAEKKAEENRELFEKETGTWRGEAVEYKLTVRGVGISGDAEMSSSMLSIANFVNGMLHSSLGYNTWVVPKDLFERLPESARPVEVFDASTSPGNAFTPIFSFDSYLVEFGDKKEARALLEKTGAFTGGYGDVTAYPFGSNTLIIEEMRGWVEKIVFWALIVVGAIAMIILTGIIGRTIADSRRESAVFRAIGATRLDIVSIYSTYVLLLSLRIVLFAFLLGISIAMLIDILYSDTATLGAQLAYAAADTDIPFHLFSPSSYYLPIIAAVIVATALLASALPIALGARRNPINDMRDEG